MKIIAYCSLHYGREYLAYAIRSVIDVVDEFWILYTPTPSHGKNNGATCPDPREFLYSLALEAAGAKLRWHDGQYHHEGEHRDMIYHLVPDADLILVVDADEVWNTGLPAHALATAMADDTVRNWRVPMIHLWRAFDKAILHDSAYPTRVIRPGVPEGDGDVPRRHEHDVIAHFGYAQSERIIAYKMAIHGHRDEFRADVDWYSEIFIANRQQDTHPCGQNTWNTEIIEPLDWMPDWMREHPYYGVKVIT